MSFPPPSGWKRTWSRRSRTRLDEPGWAPALLWQTGYLTIADVEEDDDEEVFRLGYPNLEVRRSLNRHLFARMTGRPTDPGSALLTEAPLRL